MFFLRIKPDFIQEHVDRALGGAFGMVGGWLLLFITGNRLSLTSVVGFIALVGIEVKTSILLVDLTPWAQPTGVACGRRPTNCVSRG